ncbi:MAG: PhzF family phenazine biosynthesis protein [Salinivirgaceae bacterium]|jgi:PhzF family phenazine biosynthesis protein|nr:PhzF family phenazine biosynthesis protein [Salinivirgaceae bacterium]
MTPNKTIFQVDAFTDVPFKGNPAGVMIVDETTDTEWMQNMAMEMNLSETAFISKNVDHFNIRYFTPTKEVPLCGHATLASAHILYELGIVDRQENILFKAGGGDLSIKMEEEWICMTFPRYPLKSIEIPTIFKNLLGFEPIEMYSSLYDWKIAVAASEKDIVEANPNLEGLISNSLGHLIITSESDLNDIDFAVRCFAPLSGINEDPVTGSAHCALTPLWHEKTGKTEFNSFQLSKRTGKLNVRLKNDAVEIRGKAITIFKAELISTSK